MPNEILTGLTANDADGIGQSGVAPSIATRLDFHARGIILVAAFPWRQEEIGFDGVLFGVEIVIAAPESVEGLVRAALDDAPRLRNENLIRPPNRGQPVRDYECRAAAHEVTQRLLDDRLRFRSEAGRGFIEDEDARIGQYGASD